MVSASINRLNVRQTKHTHIIFRRCRFRSDDNVNDDDDEIIHNELFAKRSNF